MSSKPRLHPCGRCGVPHRGRIEPCLRCRQKAGDAPVPFARLSSGERIGRCCAIHHTHGRCAQPIGHYRARLEPSPSPHRAERGDPWFGVAILPN